MQTNSAVLNLDLDSGNRSNSTHDLVAIGGKLPICFQVPTSKLLDVIVALAPGCINLDATRKKQARKILAQKLYNKTRPGFYAEITPKLHLGYAGQPQGHGTQHQWRIFCDDHLHAQIERLIKSTLPGPPLQPGGSANGEYYREWGGLYLRSEAEVRIAKALNETGVLFFANARGRVGLQETVVSNDQLTGRVEADFMVFCQGKCLILEVDGQHHAEAGQVIRDYARDRVLLRSGVPTVRFTAQDCFERPQAVVSELLSILMPNVPTTA
jgi:very-short-patch-repair endonuclease